MENCPKHCCSPTSAYPGSMRPCWLTNYKKSKSYLSSEKSNPQQKLQKANRRTTMESGKIITDMQSTTDHQYEHVCGLSQDKSTFRLSSQKQQEAV
jgi:hypothetical protein